MAIPPMHKMAFPIRTKEAQAFWGSRHLCNRLKAIISFSLDEEDAMHNMRRFGFQAHLRLKALHAYGAYVAMPDMDKIEFSEMSTPWWECIPDTPLPPPHGRWATWDDSENWNDTKEWKEWIPDPVPPTP